MEKYEAISVYIKQARIERSVYLGELIASAIVSTWNGIHSAADVLLSAARSRSTKNVFTFDA